VRCWGENDYGQLGYGHTDPVNSPPAELPDVQIGGPATAISAGSSFTCAVLESEEVRCWGRNLGGQLGYGHTDDIGDDEVPTDQEDPVDMGGVVRDIACGSGFSCAVLEGGGVRCWGVDLANGRLGYGAPEENVGDNESPAEAGFVNVGGGAEAVSVDTQHACVLLSSGAVRCWGASSALGIPGNNEPIGDDESPASIDPIDIGGDARQIVAGQNFNCAVREDDQVVCWGISFFGDLGYGNDDNIGDNEAPAAAGTVMLGEDVDSLSVGSASRFHSCALLVSGAVRCWGYNDDGELGLGFEIDAVGDDEVPASKDPVRILD
jgi:alpha-tubulin suppressor-like RCC1 family protein